MPSTPIRVLLVDDDEDDFILTRDLLATAEGDTFQVEWVQEYEEGLRTLQAERHDVVLLDYRLGERNGLQFLERVALGKRTPPVILLTGQGEREMDLIAMRAGATDYLVKSGLGASTLIRAIRYAVERHRSQLEKNQADARFHLLVESVGAIVWQGDPRSDRFTFVSREAEYLLGYPIARWTSEPGFWAAHIHPDDRVWATALSAAASAKDASHTIEYRMIAADGRTVWLRDIVRSREVGADRELAGVMMDITAAKEAEDRLRLQERAMQAISEGIIITDASQQGSPIVYVNQAFERLTGYSAADVLGRNCRFLQGTDTDAAAVAQVREAVLRRLPCTTELLNYRKDGSSFWNRLMISPVRDDVGRTTHFVGIQRDITEARQARTELQHAEAHYRRLVSTSPQAIFAIDVEGRFVELNAAGERLVGREAKSIIGEHYSIIFSAADLPTVNRGFDQMISGAATTIEQDTRIVLPSGAARVFNVLITAICDGPSVVGLHGVARDITEERTQQRQLRQLAAALENLRDEAVSIADESGHLQYANETHARMFGYETPAVSTLNTRSFLADDASRTEMLEIEAAVRLGGSWRGVVRRRRASDGEIVLLDVMVEGIRERDRLLFFEVSRDASERITREQHLRRMERVAGMGTLIAGVAHELNNPLTAILGFAQLLLAEPRSDADREDLTIIAREAERMAKIVSDLKLVARDTQEDRAQFEAVDLNDVAQHVLKTRRYSHTTRNIAVHVDLAKDLPPIQGNRGQIEQMLLNLVVNAEHAMASDQAPSRLIIRTRATAAGCSVHIVDSGSGIPREQLGRIFDPFYTTKSPGEGTGLGLSLVQSIVSDHDAEIHVESEVGKGTAFRIDFPLRPQLPVPPRLAPRPPDAARTLRVLVVDDEDGVRQVIARFLSRRGHLVHEATEGGQALHMLMAADEEYDVIVSDLRMPGLSGEQLLMQLQQRGSGMASRIIFLTGDTASPEAMRLLVDAHVPVLAKPVGVADLALLVEEVAGLRPARGPTTAVPPPSIVAATRGVEV